VGEPNPLPEFLCSKESDDQGMKDKRTTAPLANRLYQASAVAGWIVVVSTTGYWTIELPGLLQDEQPQNITLLS